MLGMSRENRAARTFKSRLKVRAVSCLVLGAEPCTAGVASSAAKRVGSYPHKKSQTNQKLSHLTRSQHAAALVSLLARSGYDVTLNARRRNKNNHKIAFQREEPSPSQPPLCSTCGNATSEQRGGTGAAGATPVSSGRSEVMRNSLGKVSARVNTQCCVRNVQVAVGLPGRVGFNGFTCWRSEFTGLLALT